MNHDNFKPENMLKGRMAETLVDDLLKQSGNKVYRFGYEAILQNLTQIQEEFAKYSEAGERIRAIPDFIIIDKSGNPVFLEVKFRGNGKPDEKDKKRFEKIGKFWNAKILVVNKEERPYFRICSRPYLNENGEFIATSLLSEQEWAIDKDVYIKFENLVEKYLKPSLGLNEKSNNK